MHGNRKNKMTLNSPTSPSAPAVVVSPASAIFDGVAFCSPTLVFTFENHNRFHNSSLLPYNSAITPPLLVNPRTAFSVKIIGQWPISGCRLRALIAVSGTHGPGNQSKNQNQAMRALKTILPVRAGLASLPAMTMGAVAASFPALIFTGKAGHGLCDFHGFRTIRTGFTRYSLTPDRRLALKSGWIA